MPVRILLLSTLCFVLGIYTARPQGLEAAIDHTEAASRDSIHKPQRKLLPLFIAGKISNGTVLKTQDFIRGENKIPSYQAYALKFGISSVGDTWEDITYGMPYYGIGVYTASLHRRSDLGHPISVFLFQGGTLTRISRWVQLNYEWNLGISGGWKPYDPLKNPDNLLLGSEMNAHVAANIYLKWSTISGVDIHFGVDVTHFSNGASRLPNKGINMASVYIEASYNFNRRETKKLFDPSLRAPHYDPHYVSEFLVNISSKQHSQDTTGTGLPSFYLERKFKVLGFNYAVLRVPNHRYRYGLSADLVYDESSNVWARRVQVDGKIYDVYQKGNMADRFSLGLSARGEMVLPGFSIFANLGWDMLHGNSQTGRFYQVLAAKIYLKENFFGTFGIRANTFSKAQFLFWSLGYTLDHAPLEKRLARRKNKAVTSGNIQ